MIALSNMNKESTQLICMQKYTNIYNGLTINGGISIDPLGECYINGVNRMVKNLTKNKFLSRDKTKLKLTGVCEG